MQRTVFLIASVLVVPQLHAQTDALPGAPNESPAAAQPEVLAGPKVKDAAPAGLIKRDMTGKLVRLEARPEEAALDLLSLTPEQREATKKVLDARAVKVLALLEEHHDLFIKIQNVRQSGGKREEIAPLMREFRPLAAPILDKPLADEVAAALPQEKSAEFKRLVIEYKKALAEDGPPNGAPRPRAEEGMKPDDAKAPPRPRADAFAMERIETDLLLRDMARSLQSITAARREQTEDIIRRANATPEQAEEIRKIVREPGASGLKPTAEDRAKKMEKIMAILTPEQRRRLADRRP